MTKLKRFTSTIYIYIIWAILSLFVWSWIFGIVNDTTTFHKLAIYIDCDSCRDMDLTLELEKDMPENITKVTARPLSYVIFDEPTMMLGDILVLRQSQMENYVGILAPLPELGSEYDSLPRYAHEGVVYGIQAYDPQTGAGILSDYVTFLNPGEEQEPFYLSFFIQSRHIGSESSRDTAAIEMAKRFLDTLPETDPGFQVEPVKNLRDDFILGMDASSVISLENAGVTYYGFDGQEQDVFQTLAMSGVTHIRVRIWNDPFDENGNGFGGGNCDIETAIAIGKRATRYGMPLIADFHYSDFWADPGKQQAPRAWQSLTLEEKADALYTYTKTSLQALRDAGVQVDIVQIGNETTGRFCGESNWDHITTLMKAGVRAVREVLPEARAALHFTNPEKPGSYDFYAKQLESAQVDYDIFASSYYPYWHGSLQNLASTLSGIYIQYGKPVMVMETSYAYTPDDLDFNGNTISGASQEAGYPFTVQGQADHVRSVIDTLANKTSGGMGVVYWEGTWIAAGGSSWQENNRLWETYGCGWASSFASTYDPLDAGKYYGGCAVENQAMFDSDGKPLPSLQVFRLVRED